MRAEVATSRVTAGGEQVEAWGGGQEGPRRAGARSGARGGGGKSRVGPSRLSRFCPASSSASAITGPTVAELRSWAAPDGVRGAPGGGPAPCFASLFPKPLGGVSLRPLHLPPAPLGAARRITMVHGSQLPSRVRKGIRPAAGVPKHLSV
jgi:hypothetical protein